MPGARARAEAGDLAFGTVDSWLIWHLTGGRVHATDATTVALQLGGTRTYTIEGAIFIAGAVMQWLRDGLKVIEAAPQVQALAEAADPGAGVVFVPAFTGLGAPYWAPECRGAILGLSRGAGRAEIARAALESVGQQTADLWEAMRADWAEGARGAGGAGAQVRLRVDGGMAASDWTMQALADLLGAEVDRPAVLETTALGAAWLAARGARIGPSRAEFSAAWALERRFTPAMAAPARAAARARWARAVQAVLDFGG